MSTPDWRPAVPAPTPWYRIELAVTLTFMCLLMAMRFGGGTAGGAPGMGGMPGM